MRKTFTFILAANTAVAVSAAFNMDKSAMSEAYWKIWNDGVQARIDADIEKYRKTDASAEVSAPDGTEVAIEQISHAFFFGAHIFNFNQLGTRERNERYKALYGREGALFNSATVAFYWRTFERHPYAPRFEERYEDTEEFWNNCKDPKRQPHWRRPASDPVVDYLRSRGVRIHGHPLVWGNNSWMTPNWLWDDFCPENEKLALEQASGVKLPVWNHSLPEGVKSREYEKEWETGWKKIYKLGGEKIASLVPTYLKAVSHFYEKRIRDLAERYGSRVDCWDAVNESATDFQIWGGRTAVRNRPFDASHYGPMPADYAYKAFMWAVKYLPSTAWLDLNDYNMSPSFVNQAKSLIAHGAKVDVVGSQMHLFDPKESLNIMAGKGPKHLRPEHIAARFNMLAKLDKPILLSETTITAPDLSPKGQMVQAIIARNLYRAWFSVEKMAGITWWNVVDDCGAPGEPSMSGIFTRDMQPKTAYYAMDDLINREWKTRATAKAKAGKVQFRGFRGRYRISWTAANGEKKSVVAEVK